MAKRTRRIPGRFDAWQNRPDRPTWRPGRRASGFARPILFWLGAFALLLIGHRYGDVLADAASRALDQLSAWTGR
jgi:hypothetical protein